MFIFCHNMTRRPLWSFYFIFLNFKRGDVTLHDYEMQLLLLFELGSYYCIAQDSNDVLGLNWYCIK